MANNVAHASNYRPDIDGLRAIAVLGVLIFHLNGNWLPGGFLGVDVFFVISGYLIVSIIRREVSEQKFSFKRFYQRRTFRILPAFFAAVIATSVASYFTLFCDDLILYGNSLRYAVASIGNVYFNKITGNYFNPDSSSFPLLHTWSLGVEEQFYLILPLLIWLISRIKNHAKLISSLLFITMIISYIACIFKSKTDASSAFYLIQYRAWQMLMGAMLTTDFVKKLSVYSFNRALPIVGIFFIFTSYFLVNSELFYPAFSPLGACLGACMIIFSGITKPQNTAHLLTLRPIVGIGLISYSIYIWHWPMIVLTKSHFGESLATLLSLAIASIFVGWISWKWIEVPWRTSERLKNKKSYYVFGFLALALLGYSYTIRKTEGLPGRYDESVINLLTNCKRDPKLLKAFGDQNHYDITKPLYLGHQSSDDTIAVWGDSHAVSLLPYLEKLAIEHKKRICVFALSSHLPIPGLTNTNQPRYQKNLQYTQNALDIILSDQKINAVVIHARWAQQLLGQNESKNKKQIPVQYFGTNIQSEQEKADYFASLLRHNVEILLKNGKKVFLVYPVPEPQIHVPNLLAKLMVAKTNTPSTVEIDKFDYRQRYSLFALDSIPDHPLLTRIKPHEKLLVGDRLLIQVDNNPLYFDDDHLSIFGVEYIGSLLDIIFAK